MAKRDGALIVVGAGQDAQATVSSGEGTVEITFYVCGGHVAPGVRRNVVAEVFALPELRRSWQFHASLPLGDTELLAELRRRCPSLSTRAAGATCLVEANLDPAG